jgi:glutamine---fructose-6-phosphate transaminase (isomerizing)
MMGAATKAAPSSAHPTQMLREALQAPQTVAEQLARNQHLIAQLAQTLRTQPPQSLLTLARGSSDYAAQYAAYLITARLGRLVTSLPMSLMTLYNAPLPGQGLAALAFSQSGQSPDLVVPLRSLRERSALTAAFVNDETSPLARAAQWFVPLCAGVEHSVAATKSFIAQLAAGAHLVAAWQQDAAFLQALHDLPESLAQAAQTDWSAAIAPLRHVRQLLVVGRGTGLPLAQEAALKFKETCGIAAEAFSGAEIKHGPMALLGAHTPVLIFAPRGPAQLGLLALADELRGRGAQVLLAAPRADAPHAQLELTNAPHADLAPICAVQSFYVMVEALSRARGMDPDTPPQLQKITLTH